MFQKLRALKLLLAAVVLITSGILAGDLKNAEQVDTKYKKLFAPAESKESIQKIHLEEARYLVDHADVLFVDARSKGEYMQSHIKGAVSIPVAGAEQVIKELENKLKNKILVSYCHGVGCHLSDKTAYKLFEAGYKNVLIFFGGWNEWTAANYPVEAYEPPAEIKNLLVEPESRGKIKIIKVKEAKFLYEYGLANFLDIDSVKKYQEKHLYSCVNLPYADLNNRMKSYDNWLKQKPIVVTGRGIFNTRIKKAARKLYGAGYKKVMIFYNGIDELAKAGVRVYAAPKRNKTR